MFWYRSPTSLIGMANFGSTLVTSLRSAAKRVVAKPCTTRAAIRMERIGFVNIGASFLEILRDWNVRQRRSAFLTRKSPAT
jgi:hypothetical protein